MTRQKSNFGSRDYLDFARQTERKKKEDLHSTCAKTKSDHGNRDLFLVQIIWTSQDKLNASRQKLYPRPDFQQNLTSEALLKPHIMDQGGSRPDLRASFPMSWRGVRRRIGAAGLSAKRHTGF